MTEVHRYKVVTMLSAAGATIGYDPHGPDVVMAHDLDRVTAERDAALVDRDYCKRVAEHNKEIGEQLQQRLTAADERADVLETALKKIIARCVTYIEAEREMPEPSVEVCQMIASAALKPAEANDSCEFCKGWGFRTNPDGADEGCGACNGTGKEPSDDQP